MRNDQNVICVGFAMDALNRLANLQPSDETAASLIKDLQANLLTTLKESPVQSWESLVRGGLSPESLSEFE